MIRRTAQSLLALIFLGAVGFVLWLFFRGITHWFDHQNLNVRTAIVGAVALVLVPIVTYFANRSSDQRRAVDQALRLKKRELYQRVLEFLLRVIQSSSLPEEDRPTEEEKKRFFRDVTPELITYASNKVIKVWGIYWRDAAIIAAADPLSNVNALENIMKAMRKDLGHPTISLTEGDLARLFVTDVDKAIAERKKRR